MIAGSVALIAPYVAVVMEAILGGWIVAARSLNKQFVALTAQRDAEVKATEATAQPVPAEAKS